MPDADRLWDDPIGDPEAEDIGPPLGTREIAEWERRSGVLLPAILKRAYRQQDGGYIRPSARGASLLRLKDVEPVEDGYFDSLTSDDEDVGVDPARMFRLGGDDTGADLLLHYGEPDAAAPAVYAYYGDGGSLERIAETVDGLFGE